jgi:hypothetical protein
MRTRKLPADTQCPPCDQAGWAFSFVSQAWRTTWRWRSSGDLLGRQPCLFGCRGLTRALNHKPSEFRPLLTEAI